MAKLKIPYLVAKGAAGAAPFYWQPSTRLRAAGWRPLRLSDQLPLAVAEAKARNEAVDAQRDTAETPRAAKAPTGSVTALIAEYKRSDYYLERAPATRRSYDQALGIINGWIGPELAIAIKPKHVQKLYRAMRKRAPAYAAAVVRVGQVLWKRGRLLGMVGDLNPFADQNLRSSDPSGVIWPREAIDAFVHAADALGRHSIGTAALLGEWIGQREHDLLRAPRAMIARGELVLRQAKTRAPVRLPVGMVPHLVERLEAELARIDARKVVSTGLIVSEETGTLYKPDDFRHQVQRIRAAMIAGDVELKIPATPTFTVDFVVPGHDPDGDDAYKIGAAELKVMHLRHTAVVRLAEAGVDLVLIASVTGHSERTVQGIIGRYAVKTGKMALAAFKQRLEHEAGGSA